MLTVRRTLKLRDDPSDSSANTQGTVRTGFIVEKIVTDGDWTKIRVFGPGTSTREGWVKTASIVDRAPPPPVAIDLESFALVTLYSARDFDTNAYFLVALAHVLSGIENKVDPVTKRRGPFQFSADQWVTLLGLHSGELEGVGRQDIDDPYLQCLVAALTIREATEQLQTILPDKRLPTAGELYLSQVLGLPAAKAVLAGDQTRKIDEPLQQHFASQADTEAFVKALLDKHAEFFKIGDEARTVEQVIEAVGMRFDEGLKRAGELIDALPADERAISTPDNPGDTHAPWMTFAKAEIGQTEDMRKGKTNLRIQEYHKVSHPSTPRLDDIAWCAAFVSWCMEKCEQQIIRTKNIKSALAADWIKWGKSIEQPVYGAVVVMEPLVSGSSGHVGFSMGIEGDHVLLLGGNQRDLSQTGNPDAVCVRKFRLSKVRGFRWLDGFPIAAPGGTGATNFNTSAVPAGRLDIANLIVMRFAEAGYQPIHQIAALANAIKESKLNPNAHNPHGEDSVGLFQLNRQGGLGVGHSLVKLKDPEFNIRIILKAAKGVNAFGQADTIEKAVDVFVRKIERPADQNREVTERLAIAKTLLT